MWIVSIWRTGRRDSSVKTEVTRDQAGNHVQFTDERQKKNSGSSYGPRVAKKTPERRPGQRPLYCVIP
jgi:hypothetical protein